MAVSCSLPQSLWAATSRTGLELEPLSGSCAADIAVVGAGYAGLSTALHLAEGGAKVVVVDSHEPGWGASGRNGGQVLAGLRPSKGAVVRLFGEERGARMYETGAGAARFLFALVERNGIDCDLWKGGNIRLAHSPKALAELEARAQELKAEGVPVRMLGADEAAQMAGTRRYLGGMLDSRGGNLHPLDYARGLAAAALRSGARIFRDTRALGLEREGNGNWRLRTSGGDILAKHVVLATNGYTDGLWPGLAETVLPVHSFQIATAPIAAPLIETILPGRQSVSDTRRLILYFQRSADGRLVLGGRASFSLADRATDYDVLCRVLEGLFPQLSGIEIAYRWAGRVALTRDFLPHLHEPAPGLVIALGFNGKGVAMATLMGRIVASRILEPREESPFPVTRIAPIPFHAFRQPALHLAMHYQSVMDRLGR